MIQVMPNAMTTFQCQRPQGSRSILAGTSVLIGAAGPSAVLIASPLCPCPRSVSKVSVLISQTSCRRRDQARSA